MGRPPTLEKRKRAAAVEAAGPPPEPNFPEGTAPREKAERMCNYLETRIKWARDTLAPDAELLKLSAQYRTWVSLLAKFTGASAITAVQVVRHPDFQRALGLIREALGDDREAWVKLEAGLAALMGNVS